MRGGSVAGFAPQRTFDLHVRDRLLTWVIARPPRSRFSWARFRQWGIVFENRIYVLTGKGHVASTPHMMQCNDEAKRQAQQLVVNGNPVEV